MKPTAIKNAALLFLAALFLAPPACEVGIPGIKGKGGPPPHAKAYGRRAKRAYSYYPAFNMYFDPVRKVYFRLSGGIWKIRTSIPFTLKLKLGSGVSLEMDTDKPYKFNAQHKLKYKPPKKAKKRKKGKGRKKKK